MQVNTRIDTVNYTVIMSPDLFPKTVVAGGSVLRFHLAGAEQAVLVPAAALGLHIGTTAKLFLRLPDELVHGLVVHAAGAGKRMEGKIKDAVLIVAKGIYMPVSGHDMLVTKTDGRADETG